MTDYLSMKMSGSPAPNQAMLKADQLTPISRILQGQKVNFLPLLCSFVA